jgi:hypothetical protein
MAPPASLVPILSMLGTCRIASSRLGRFPATRAIAPYLALLASPFDRFPAHLLSPSAPRSRFQTREPQPALYMTQSCLIFRVSATFVYDDFGGSSTIA